MQRMMKFFAGLNAAAYRKRSVSPAVNQFIGAKNAALTSFTIIIHHLAKQGFLLVKQGFLLVKLDYILVTKGSLLVKLDYLLVKQVILLVKQGYPLVK